MNLTIDLSEQNAAALEAQARAARMPAEHYLAHIVARALERQHAPAGTAISGLLTQSAATTNLKAYGSSFHSRAGSPAFANCQSQWYRH